MNQEKLEQGDDFVKATLKNDSVDPYSSSSQTNTVDNELQL